MISAHHENENLSFIERSSYVLRRTKSSTEELLERGDL